MIYIGMIFQYDGTQGKGLIMLTDGEKKEFTTDEWIDSENMPAVGQKISYKSSSSKVKIRVATQEDLDMSLLPEAEQKSDEEEIKSDFDGVEPVTVDDFINYFTSLGYKLIKDLKDETSRSITLRMYTPADYGEATINLNGSEMSVVQTLNGKTVLTR